MPNFERNEEEKIATDRGSLVVESEITDPIIRDLAKQVNTVFKEIDKIFQAEFSGKQSSPEIILINDVDLSVFTQKSLIDSEFKANLTANYLRTGTIFLNIERLLQYIDSEKGTLTSDGILLLKAELSLELANHYSVKFDERTNTVSTFGLSWVTSLEGGFEYIIRKDKKRQPIRRVVRFEEDESHPKGSINVDQTANEISRYRTSILKTLISCYVLPLVCERSELLRISVITSSNATHLHILNTLEVRNALVFAKVKINDIVEALNPYHNENKLRLLTGSKKDNVQAASIFADALFNNDPKYQLNLLTYFTTFQDRRVSNILHFNKEQES